jgi:hypothetical protein
MELTAALDHHLTDSLVLSAEGRWDRGRADDFPNSMFLSNASGNPYNAGPGLNGGDFADNKSNHQVLGLVQLRYDF